MSFTNYYSPSKSLQLKEGLMFGLVGWIPNKPGIMLRNLLYKKILRDSGKSIRIENGVKLISAFQIEIGKEVTISQNACLNSYGLNNQIKIGNHSMINSNVFICSASGENNQILVGEHIKLDSNVSLNSYGDNSKISIKESVFLDRGVDIRPHDKGFIEIGEGTYIGPYVCIAGPGHIRIGKDCLIASHSGIYANNHLFADPTIKIKDQGVVRKGITIEDDCWLGSGVRVLDGVTIGQGSVIGAGAVVTKDIPPFSVAVGVPAKVISHRDKVHGHLVEVGNF